jgi:hypothetical protein
MSRTELVTGIFVVVVVVVVVVVPSVDTDAVENT